MRSWAHLSSKDNDERRRTARLKASQTRVPAFAVAAESARADAAVHHLAVQVSFDHMPPRPTQVASTPAVAGEHRFALAGAET